jgi:uncharacterized membrane protein
MNTQTQDQRIHFSPEMSLKDLSPNVAALLCYVGAWVTGIVFLVLEQKNLYVRFHALQSIIVFGSLSVAGTILSHVPFFGTGFTIFFSAVGFVLWLVLMINANQGLVFKLPWAGNLAERLALESTGQSSPQAGSSNQSVPNNSDSVALEPPIGPAGRSSQSTSRDRFQQKYYSFGPRTGRIVGSSFAIAWCMALLIFFNFFSQYIAYYSQLSPGHWQIHTLITPDFDRWLPILNATLALTILANVLFIVYDRYFLRQTGKLLLGILGLATVISLIMMFPFDFNVIPNADASYWAPLGLLATLILIAFGTGIGILVRFIQLIVHTAEGRF